MLLITLLKAKFFRVLCLELYNAIMQRRSLYGILYRLQSKTS